MLSNACFLEEFGFDTAENEPTKKHIQDLGKIPERSRKGNDPKLPVAAAADGVARPGGRQVDRRRGRAPGGAQGDSGLWGYFYAQIHTLRYEDFDET